MMKVIWVAPQQELAKYEQEKEDARIAIENREGLITDYVQINYHSATVIFKALTEAKGMGEVTVHLIIIVMMLSYRHVVGLWLMSALIR